MMIVLYGRGGGNGLRLQGCSNNAENFIRQNSEFLLQLAESEMDKQSNTLKAVINFDRYMITIYARLVNPKYLQRPSTEERFQKQELRPYIFSQMLITDLEEYALEISGRLAFSKIKQYFYNGDDSSSYIPTKYQNGQSFLQAKNHGQLLAERLNPKEKLRYAYMGILLYEGELNAICLEHFQFEELMSIIAALLPFFVNEKMTYVRGGQINAEYSFYNLEYRSKIKHDYDKKAQFFFSHHPNFKAIICANRQTRITAYREIENERYNQQVSTPVWELCEYVCSHITQTKQQYRTTNPKNSVKKRNKTIEKTHKKNPPAIIHRKIPLERNHEVYEIEETSIEPLILSREIIQIVQRLLEVYSIKDENLFYELYSKAYRNFTSESIGILQHKIRAKLTEGSCTKKNRTSYLLLISCSCEVSPEVYIRKRREERFETPLMPIDTKLAEKCIKKIYKTGINRISKQNMLITDLKDWIWNH